MLNRQKRDAQDEKPTHGAIGLYNLIEQAKTSCITACSFLPVIVHELTSLSECYAYAEGSVPTVLITSSWPHLDARLLNSSHESLRRATVVVAAPDDTEAEYWCNLAWDAYSIAIGPACLDALLKCAIRESDRRRREWDMVEDFHNRHKELNAEELQVLEAVCDGRLNKQIANDLGVSIRTVEQRRRRVFDKMDVDSAVPLASRVAKVQALESLNHSQESPEAGDQPNLYRDCETNDLNSTNLEK